MGPDSKDNQRITRDVQTGRNHEYNIPDIRDYPARRELGKSANGGRWTCLWQTPSPQDMQIITILYNTQTPQVSKSNNQSEKIFKSIILNNCVFITDQTMRKSNT